MIQWLLKLILAVMGQVYVVIDGFVKYPVEKIAEIPIDIDFQIMGRRKLCNHLEDRFGLDKDVFWNLPSTSKIRLGCQLGRNLKKEV
jgi:hypothetical protein